MCERHVLKRQKDFDAVYNNGRSVASRHIVLFYARNRLGYSRISFLASKKVGNSVQRHRATRLMKEAFRLSGQVIDPGYDLVIIARNSITEAGLSDVMRSLETVFKKTRGVLM
jgi:ribonuclease P protein component